MKKIPLTQGKIALVDDEDFDWLNKFKWHVTKGKGTFYAQTTLTKDFGSYKKGKNLKMHRAIMNLNFGDKVQVDHIDHNGWNNQKENLRVVTNRQNSQNRKGNFASKYPGVTFESGKWNARIRINNIKTYLGRFNKEEDAAQAYQDKLEEVERNEQL